MRKTAKPSDPAGPGMARYFRAARLVLIWERAWPVFWPVPSLLALFLALSLFDALPLLPGWLHAMVLLLFVLLLSWSGLQLWRLRRPSKSEVRRRIEQDSGLSHRPFDSLADGIALGRGDSIAESLWAAEKKRVQSQLERLRSAPPRPVLAGRDPWGLRFVPWALLLIALLGPHADFGPRLARAVSPELPHLGGPPPILQVWITPPAYTHLPPIMLDARPAMGLIRIPEGSAILAELQGGGGKASLVLDRERRKFERLGTDSQRIETTVAEADRIVVRQSFRTVASWDVEIVRDQAPTISWAAPPEPDADARLRLPVKAEDDYGIAGLWLEIRAAESNSSALASHVDLPLGSDHPPSVRQSIVQDLTAERLAGSPVKIRLGVKDETGHSAFSDERELVLPERHFLHPVAQAIVVERRNLIAKSIPAQDVARRLRVLAWSYDKYGGDILAFLCLTDASARLAFDQTEDAASQVIDLLWLTALRIEEGDKPMAKLAFDQAAQELRDALAKGADPAEIGRLLNQLKQAAERYLQAMASQAMRQGAQPQDLPPGAREISEAEISSMLDRLRDLSETGSKDAAGQALAELQTMLNGLDGAMRMPGSAEAARRARQNLDELRELEHQQRELLDETFRKDKRDAAPPSQTDSRAMAQRQEDLRKRLGKLMEKLDEMGVDVPPALGDAGRAMGDAEKALKGLEFDDAIDAESDALTHLQNGAREAAKAMAGKMGGGLANGRDPLGRPGLGDDGSVVVPKQGDPQKAREVLDELRRRSGEGERPLPERDYLQRLLKGFY